MTLDLVAAYSVATGFAFVGGLWLLGNYLGVGT